MLLYDYKHNAKVHLGVQTAILSVQESSLYITKNFVIHYSCVVSLHIGITIAINLTSDMIE